jgi:hypothetical protein
MNDSLLTRPMGRHAARAGVALAVAQDRRSAGCALWSHPIGWELRVTVDAELVRSQAYRQADDALRDLDDWRQQFAGKGWQTPTDSSH